MRRHCVACAIMMRARGAPGPDSNEGKRNADRDRLGTCRSEQRDGVRQRTGFTAKRVPGVRRPKDRVHEELCRTDLQDRISNVHEIVSEKIEPI
jgi:hypothetical protein